MNMIIYHPSHSSRSFCLELENTSVNLLSENTNKDSPTNYYLNTDDLAFESPFDTIDIQTTQSLRSQAYHPLVSVEIGKVENNNNNFQSCV